LVVENPFIDPCCSIIPANITLNSTLPITCNEDEISEWNVTEVQDIFVFFGDLCVDLQTGLQETNCTNSSDLFESTLALCGFFDCPSNVSIPGENQTQNCSDKIPVQAEFAEGYRVGFEDGFKKGFANGLFDVIQGCVIVPIPNASNSCDELIPAFNGTEVQLRIESLKDLCDNLQDGIISPVAAVCTNSVDLFESTVALCHYFSCSMNQNNSVPLSMNNEVVFQPFTDPDPVDPNCPETVSANGRRPIFGFVSGYRIGFDHGFEKGYSQAVATFVGTRTK